MLLRSKVPAIADIESVFTRMCDRNKVYSLLGKQLD
jgi:hypothetical protein